LRCGRQVARTFDFTAIYASVHYGEYLGDPGGASIRRYMRLCEKPSTLLLAIAEETVKRYRGSTSNSVVPCTKQANTRHAYTSGTLSSILGYTLPPPSDGHLNRGGLCGPQTCNIPQTLRSRLAVSVTRMRTAVRITPDRKTRANSQIAIFDS
jgi:hypothetical protein